MTVAVYDVGARVPLQVGFMVEFGQFPLVGVEQLSTLLRMVVSC